MKNPFLIIIYTFIILIIFPVILTFALYRTDKPVINNSETIKDKDITTINVYNHRTNKIEKMNIEEYLYNVVASEMPATFHEEALKAQAIAARTYVFYKMENGGENNDKHPGAVVCTDHTHCQEYLSLDQLKNAHGKEWVNDMWPKVKKAVQDTKGMILKYEGKVVEPLYHSTSGGKTENSEEVFAAKVPYLRSVESPHEEGSPRLIAVVKMTEKEFKSKLKSIYNNMKFSNDLSKDINILSRTTGGSVKEVVIGSVKLRGRDVRSALNLNSADFEISVKDGYVSIQTRGYGHGVGMSQWGANGMANQGYKYDEILKHYFKGVDIQKIY
ncbi:stage II sporulation protein D [Alkalithermobacter thermoalcaliphilus JW-YL-7 = DSM 7308]|uniref:Stage II sporulation protein D n=1 Tax=Alkalithermobacter thermoalcaliphilus JW-YL-7 = DSM 7308 TaxID=1121328 RepID=A0A150FN27_CLOPD|nr:stage II sporulation protein D [[Clostridium] paradoxum JW-YL-7 = DSM 7308]SHL05003.1 stage II sporulation protein D [[Clostridium] paradoxum JW-YL-7 = DSM 7308]